VLFLEPHFMSLILTALTDNETLLSVHSVKKTVSILGVYQDQRRRLGLRLNYNGCWFFFWSTISLVNGQMEEKNEKSRAFRVNNEFFRCILTHQPFPAPELSAEGEYDGRMLYTLADDQASPTVFFEPFSRTSYWERQEVWLELPDDGWYIDRVSDATQRTERYVLAMRTKEIFGGDLLFLLQFKRTYWKPVE